MSETQDLLPHASPEKRQRILDIVMEALELYDAKKTQAQTESVIAEYKKPSLFGLQDEKIEKEKKGSKQ
jgi:hypothetical protein